MTGVHKNHGIDLRLPFGHKGKVCLTDVRDNYDEIDEFLKECEKTEIVECFVLRKAKKFADVSLRQSR